jgi:hypothetical protein
VVGRGVAPPHNRLEADEEATGAPFSAAEPSGGSGRRGAMRPRDRRRGRGQRACGLRGRPARRSRRRRPAFSRLVCDASSVARSLRTSEIGIGLVRPWVVLTSGAAAQPARGARASISSVGLTISLDQVRTSRSMPGDHARGHHHIRSLVLPSTNERPPVKDDGQLHVADASQMLRGAVGRSRPRLGASREALPSRRYREVGAWRQPARSQRCPPWGRRNRHLPVEMP